ncbi:unnamed protein product [Trichobilharzia szidati]|nr:unnamed protein product [Trichobilharzia szidati]
MSRNIRIAVITLLAFAAINEGGTPNFANKLKNSEKKVQKLTSDSSKLKKVKRLLSSTKGGTPNFANKLKNSEKKVQKLTNKLAKKGKRTDEYVNCIREQFKYKYGNKFDKLVSDAINSNKNNVYKNDESVMNCLKTEGDEYRSKEQDFNSQQCDKYLVKVDASDVEKLIKSLDNEYYNRAKFGASVFLKNLHETAVNNLKKIKKRN